MAARSYKTLKEENERMLTRLVANNGVSRHLVENILTFTRCMVKHNSGDRVDSLIFMAVLFKYFEILDGGVLKTLYHQLSKGNHDEQIGVESFANVLAGFFSDNMDTKVDYFFLVCDVNGNGDIDPSEIADFIKTCKCGTDLDDSEKEDTFTDMMTIACEQMGLGPDDSKTYEEFKRDAKENLFYHAIVKQCLPSEPALERMRTLLSSKTGKEVRDMFRNLRQELLHETIEFNKYYPIELEMFQIQ